MENSEKYRTPTDVLLDGLDKSVNSNTVLLYFEIPSIETFDIKRFLTTQLKTGYFHFMLLLNHVERGWENFTHNCFPLNWKDNFLMFPLPGTSWNGNENLLIEELAEHKASEYIIDLLTGGGHFFTRSALGTPFDTSRANRILGDFIEQFKKHKYSFYRIEPDFLWLADDRFNADNDLTRLGYFENAGRDFALAIFTNDEEGAGAGLRVLLVNGYG